MSKDPKTRDRYLLYRRNDREEMVAAPPLDLSFQRATKIEDLMNKPAQMIRTGRLPPKSSKNHYITCSLWLSNNALANLDKLEKLVNHVLEEPSNLFWLDLSFNELNDVDNDLLKFEKLQILYLQGNNISDINSLLKLRNLPKLRNLTLQGNPIEFMTSYRGYVVAILPQITRLDFSPVLESERRMALPTGFFKMVNLDSK